MTKRPGAQSVHVDLRDLAGARHLLGPLCVSLAASMSYVCGGMIGDGEDAAEFDRVVDAALLRGYVVIPLSDGASAAGEGSGAGRSGWGR